MATKSQRTRRAPARLERYEQADGVKLLRSLGAAVYVLGTHRRAGDYQGTMQTPGIADVEAWLSSDGARLLELDRKYKRIVCRRLLKWEVKRARGGRLSPEQAAYRDHCQDAGIDYVCGDLSALMRWLVSAGYLRRDQLPADHLTDHNEMTS